MQTSYGSIAHTDPATAAETSAFAADHTSQQHNSLYNAWAMHPKCNIADLIHDQEALAQWQRNLAQLRQAQKS